MSRRRTATELTIAHPPARPHQRRCRSFRYRYDFRGNQTDWTTDARESKRSYYPNGKLALRTAKRTGEDPDTRGYDYAYNGRGSLTEMRDRQAGRSWKMAFDSAERLSSVNEAWSTGKDSTFAYDADDNVAQRRTDGRIDTSTGSYRGGKTTTFASDSIGRERRMEVRQAGQADGDARVTLNDPKALEGLRPSRVDDLARNAGFEVLPGKASAKNAATRYYVPGTNRSVGFRVLPGGVAGQSGIKAGPYLRYFGGPRAGQRVPLGR